MLRWLIDASLRNRFLVLFLAGLAIVAGGWAASRLPIDAVPDITNRQVQINTVVPSLAPEEVEAQVTFPSRRPLPELRARLHSLTVAQRL